MILTDLDRTQDMTTQTAPKTVSDWQLYSGMKGASEAARKLTSALKRTEKAVRKDLLAAERAGETDTAVAGSIMYKHYSAIFVPVQHTYASQGAYDTEPRTVAKCYLEKVAEDYGFYGYIDF